MIDDDGLLIHSPKILVADAPKVIGCRYTQLELL